MIYIVKTYILEQSNEIVSHHIDAFVNKIANVNPKMLNCVIIYIHTAICSRVSKRLEFRFTSVVHYKLANAFSNSTSESIKLNAPKYSHAQSLRPHR